jgi:hypothetical protein
LAITAGPAGAATIVFDFNDNDTVVDVNTFSGKALRT